MIVYYACIFLFDFTCCHAICLLVLVNSDAHIGPGVINLEILCNNTLTRTRNVINNVRVNNAFTY